VPVLNDENRKIQSRQMMAIAMLSAQDRQTVLSIWLTEEDL
jgi:hypothetical protein